MLWLVRTYTCMECGILGHSKIQAAHNASHVCSMAIAVV